MDTKTLIGVVAAVAVAGAVFYWFAAGEPHNPMLADNAQEGASAMAPIQDNMGTYPYECDNGAAMTMTPASDMSAVYIAPNGVASQGKVPEALLKAAGNAQGARFEGSGVVFVGAGEEITLTMGTTTVHCNPLPNPDMAPFNWGDAGDGGVSAQWGSQKPDAALVVSESIEGKWQSTDDAKFMREFTQGGAVVDYYDGKAVSRGTAEFFTSASAPANFTLPLQANTVYVRLSMEGSQSDYLNFKVAKLSPDELQLVYLDRGGVLSFKAVQ